MDVPVNQAQNSWKKCTGVPALPRDTYHVYLAIYVDRSQSAMFSACH